MLRIIHHDVQDELGETRKGFHLGNSSYFFEWNGREREETPAHTIEI
jgi:hypothetical protein